MAMRLSKEHAGGENMAYRAHNMENSHHTVVFGFQDTNAHTNSEYHRTQMLTQTVNTIPSRESRRADGFPDIADSLLREKNECTPLVSL